MTHDDALKRAAELLREAAFSRSEGRMLAAKLETLAAELRIGIMTGAPQPAQEIVEELTHEELAQRPKRQYFYRVPGCPAVSSTEARCICWHDEGAGPFPKGDAGTVSLEWRDTLQTSPQPKEKS